MASPSTDPQPARDTLPATETEPVRETQSAPETQPTPEIQPVTPQQLWQRLPGSYCLDRDSFIENTMNDQGIIRNAVMAQGLCTSKIEPRAPTDPAYQSELLHDTRLRIASTRMKLRVKTEQLVFRIQNGEWSVWDTDGNGVVTQKLADLKHQQEPTEPEASKNGPVRMDGRMTTVRPWEDQRGEHELELRFLPREYRVDMTMHHRIRATFGTEQVDEYERIPILARPLVLFGKMWFKGQKVIQILLAKMFK